MLFKVPMALFIAVISIWVAIRVNRRANVATTVTHVLLPFAVAPFAWNDWIGWHTASGNAAVQYAVAFVFMGVAVAAALTALRRRLWWLRRHPQGG